MLALLYLGLAICVGERLSGRFFRFVSTSHRWATGALVGLLLSTGFTYLAARHFSSASNPLLWGDLLFFAAATIFLVSCPSKRDPALIQPRAPGSEKWTWITLALYTVLVSWMMFAVLDFKGGTLLIGITQWSDYGPNTAIVQSFALGHNFPTQYPHFSGEPIRYHFLFYFLAGNLEFLGLNLVWSLNLISTLTLVCMLALVIAFGQLLFKSRAVGCIASWFFFFHGTLNCVAFLRRQTSFKGALLAIYGLRDYLTSGYPYRGEDWGIWTQVVFINQRHLASSIGIFLVVLIFLFDRYLERAKEKERERALAAGYTGPGGWETASEPSSVTDLEERHELVDQATYDALADDRPTPDEHPFAEQSSPAPETIAGSEEQPSEESAPAGNYASEAEHQTFATRAYEEYMRRESDASAASSASEARESDASAASSVSEAQESEALEFANESSREPEIPPASEAPPPQAPVPEPISEPISGPSRGMIAQLVHDNLVSGQGFIFCGLLLGALPYWNAPVFTASAAVLAFLFVLYPCRRYMVGLAITAAVVALPQILALRAGNARSGASLINWGYTLGHVPVWLVVKYLGFTFGIKWILILVGLLFFSWRYFRLFIAIFSLFLLTFCFQFSDEALANHKFLNIWLVIANLFVAYGLWRLWHLRIKGWAIPSRVLAVLLAFPIILGGVIDFFPIHNGGFVYTTYTSDRLIRWVQAETKPDAVFMTDKFVNHQILLAGRRIFMGYTYFTWSAGYDLPKREIAYRQMLENKNAHQVFTLLKLNGIDYVAFDNTVRGTFKNNNEQQVYAPNFKKVFDGSDYYSLTIYKVPENADFIPVSSGAAPGETPASPTISLFEAGPGKDNGQFNFPRGLAVDNAGNMFVADTNNDRLQKFSPAGIFLSVIGKRGSGPGQFLEPGGIAVDSGGNIYVADVSNHRVQKLKSDGSFLAEWKGPEPGFVAPRDIAVGPGNSVYVVDQGRSQIFRLDPNGKVQVVWGTGGQDDGQLAGPTSIAVDGKNDRVYVADPSNKRIEVFDSNGKFIAKWPVPEWGAPTGWYFQDLLVDSQSGRIYASSNATNEVLVFDLTGKKLANLRAKPPENLEGASGLILVKGKLYVLNTFGNRISQIVLESK